MKRFRSVATLVVAGAAVMVSLIGVRPAGAQTLPITAPPDIDCPAGTTAYLTPRAPQPQRGGVVLPPLLYAGDPRFVTDITLPAGRFFIDSYVSWDGYISRASTPAQPAEQWAVQVGGVRTGLTADLADGVTVAITTGSLGFIDQPGGVVEIIHSSLTRATPSGSPDSVHPSGFCWRLDQPFDLALTKIVTPLTVLAGEAATYTIRVRNNGPGVASAGWTITDVLPAGLVVTGASGNTLACVLGSSVVCTSSAPLASGDTVVLTVVATVSGSGSHKNVAYVTPNPNDLPESVVLGTPPGIGTDTVGSPTNNDGEAVVTLAVPTGPTTPTTTPTPTTTTSISPATTSTVPPTTVTAPATLPPTPPAFAVVTSTIAPTTTLAPVSTTTAVAAAPASGVGSTTAPTTAVAPQVLAVATTAAPVQVLGTEIINSTTGSLAVTGSDNHGRLMLAAGLIAAGTAMVLTRRLRRR